MTHFERLRANYPTESRESLFRNVLRAGWPDLLPNENYLNTCAIRMSVAFNRTGSPIPPQHSDGGHRDHAGQNVTVRVATMHKVLLAKFGAPTWGVSKVPGTPFSFTDLPIESGIVMYRAEFADASGHVDLWRGVRCVGRCPQPDLELAYEIMFWRLG